MYSSRKGKRKCRVARGGGRRDQRKTGEAGDGYTGVDYFILSTLGRYFKISMIKNLNNNKQSEFSPHSCKPGPVLKAFYIFTHLSFTKTP